VRVDPVPKDLHHPRVVHFRGRFVPAVQDDPVAQYPAQETDRGAVEHRHLDPADAGVRHERVRNSRRHPFGIS
jgi:hypothetical protein